MPTMAGDDSEESEERRGNSHVLSKARHGLIWQGQRWRQPDSPFGNLVPSSVVSSVLCKRCSIRPLSCPRSRRSRPSHQHPGCKTARSGQGRAVSRRGASEPLPASTVLRFRMQTGGSGGYEDPRFPLVSFERFWFFGCFGRFSSFPTPASARATASETGSALRASSAQSSISSSDFAAPARVTASPLPRSGTSHAS
jgi:hypothetical protein